VAALAEVEEGLAREVRLLDRERIDDNAGSGNKNIALTASVRPNLSFEGNAELREFAALIRQRSAVWVNFATSGVLG
jgi:hypothetical protein